MRSIPEDQRTAVGGSNDDNRYRDRVVSTVKTYLKKHLNDPSSLEFIRWGELQNTYDGGFMVDVKYRAKHAFGGLVLIQGVFYLSSTGDVLYCKEY